jgi:hypothetical protein
MKRYIFSFSLPLLLVSATIFGRNDEAYFLTIFTKEDVAKHWLVKQLHLQDSAKKDVVEGKINLLLASMKDKHIKCWSELRRMNINRFACVRMGKDSPAYGHYFAFDKPDSAAFADSIYRRESLSIVYAEGRMWGGNSIPEFHELWSGAKMKAKGSLDKRFEFEKAWDQIEPDMIFPSFYTSSRMREGCVHHYAHDYDPYRDGGSAKERLGQLFELERALDQIELDSLSDFNPAWFLSLDVD